MVRQVGLLPDHASHPRSALLGICDRIYTLSAGRITGEMPVREATQENLMALMTKERETVG